MGYKTRSLGGEWRGAVSRRPLDYAVAEKLLNFAEGAAQHPEFGRELPLFVSRVRQMFTAQELVVHLARIERERRENDLAAMENDDAPFRKPGGGLGADAAIRSDQGVVDR